MIQKNENSKPLINQMWYFIGIPFFIGILIATFSPLNVLEYNVFRIINEIAAFIFPGVRKIKGDYELGQVAKLYFSVMWLMTPFIFIGGYRDFQKRSEIIISKCKEKKVFSFLFGIFFFPAFVIFMMIVNFESKDMDDVRVLLTFHSRWGMPLWGFLIPGGAAMMCALIFFYIRNFSRIFD
ncbi:hypothetical protein D3C78_190670 [compost metagenome]